MKLSLKKVKEHRNFIFEEYTKVINELSVFEDGVDDLDDEEMKNDIYQMWDACGELIDETATLCDCLYYKLSIEDLQTLVTARLERLEPELIKLVPDYLPRKKFVDILLDAALDDWDYAQEELDELSSSSGMDIPEEQIGYTFQRYSPWTVIMDPDGELVVINTESIFDMEEYKVVKEDQEGKTLYIPTEHEIEQYCEFCILKDTTYYRNALKEMRKFYDINETKAEEELTHVMHSFLYGKTPQDMMGEVGDSLIGSHAKVNNGPVKLEKLQSFFKALVDLYNHTGLILNKGYSPAGLADYYKRNGMVKPGMPTVRPGSSKAAEQFMQNADFFAANDIPVDFGSDVKTIPTWKVKNGQIIERGSKKVYPNDPCPCGSGKKFKKCCGRNASASPMPAVEEPQKSVSKEPVSSLKESLFAKDMDDMFDSLFPGIFDMMEGYGKNGVETYADAYTFIREFNAARIRKGMDSIKPDFITILYMTYLWRKNRVIYQYDRTLTEELVEQGNTMDKDGEVPADFLLHLPYDCIAVNLSKLDAGAKVDDYDPVVMPLDGHVLIKVAKPGELDEWPALVTSWSMMTGGFMTSVMPIKEGATLADCMTHLKQMINAELKQRVTFEADAQQSFNMIRLNNIDALMASRFAHDTIKEAVKAQGGKLPYEVFSEDQNDAYKMIESEMHETLAKIAAQVVLYLVSVDSDIEDAAEKMKDGRWSSLLDETKETAEGTDESEEAEKSDESEVDDTGHGTQDENELKQAVKELKKSKTVVKDVGYRIGYIIRKGEKTPADDEDESDDHNDPTGKHGKSKRAHMRRGHWHHFWVGSKTGDDRKLVIKWIKPIAVKGGIIDKKPTLVKVKK